MLEEFSLLCLDVLLKTHTPSGYETFSNPTLKKKFDRHIIGFNSDIDTVGNIIWKKGSTDEKALKILLSAHYDENALQISNITDDGMIHVIPLGGIDIKTILGSHVSIILDDVDSETKEHITVKGIIGKKPIHKETKEERETVNKIEKILVDVGATTKDEVLKAGIHVGLPVVFDKNVQLSWGINSDKIVANGLDDKIGIYCVTQAFNVIDDELLKQHNIQLILAWFAQEEVGLRGATIASKTINPNISIDVDTTFDTSKFIGSLKDNESDIKLGRGVVIDYGPQNNFELVNTLRDISMKNGIVFQEQTSKPGSNNCSAIQINSSSCITAHLAIPQRNMHTQVEMCHWDDVQNCINLLVKFINKYV